MKLLKNVASTKKILEDKEIEYDGLMKRIKVLNRSIPILKRSLDMKNKHLNRVATRHNIQTKQLKAVINNEISKSKKKEEDVLNLLLGGNIDGTMCVNSYNSNKIHNNIPFNTAARFNHQHVNNKNVILPVFSDKNPVFKHALDKIVKRLAVRRLQDIGKVQFF